MLIRRNFVIKDTVVTKESPEERMTNTAFIKHAGWTGSTGRGGASPQACHR